MGLRVKGGMACPRCGAQVTGVKTTHRVRNTSSALLLPFTGGLSMLGFRVERYVCPRCGSTVRRRVDPGVRVAALVFTVIILLIVAAQHV